MGKSSTDCEISSISCLISGGCAILQYSDDGFLKWGYYGVPPNHQWDFLFKPSIFGDPPLMETPICCSEFSGHFSFSDRYFLIPESDAPQQRGVEP